MLGTSETRDTCMDGKEVSSFREPLPSSGKNNGSLEGHQQRNPRKARTPLLSRLLLIGLNRRMPNGTYGGVRGATS